MALRLAVLKRQAARAAVPVIKVALKGNLAASDRLMFVPARP
jgi:hypothetical protein